MEQTKEDRMKIFLAENGAATKGPLSLLVQITRSSQSKEFPP
jgi:hypothetical protein